MDDPERLAREQEHDRRILARAEDCWGWSTPAGARRVRRRLELIRKTLSDCPGPWLEVGCGTGVFTRGLPDSHRGAALDISMEFLREARSSADGVGCVQGDAHRLPFRDGVFGAIYGVSVLHHLHPRAALPEWRRVLRPGGRLFLSEPNLANPVVFAVKTLPFLKRLAGDVRHERAFLRGTLARILAAAGFDEVEVSHFDFLFPFTPRVCVGVVDALGLRLERLPLVREAAGSLLVSARRPVEDP